MAKKIAILRGINVGGKRKILMQDLKDLFGNLGYKNMETYIQSGNVIFDTDDLLTDNEISETIEKAISEKYGFTVPVILRSVDELAKAIELNPFYSENQNDVTQLHLTFLKDVPTDINRLKAESHNFEPDKFVIEGKDVFIYCTNKYHQTKLSNDFFENKLKTSATTRNWKTVLKLFELSN